MNSFSGASGKPQRESSSVSASLNNFEFDFGLGSNRNDSRPLRDQKNPVTSANTFSSSSSSSSSSRTAFTSSSPSSSSWVPNKTSWTHQPAPNPAPGSGVSKPTSMAGDIFGKSWSSTASATGLGIAKKDPNLFGDLVGSALGQSKGSGNVPLKAAPPRNSYSMGNLADSLPKTTATANPVKPTAWGSADDLGSYSSPAGNHATYKTGNPSGGYHTLNKSGNPLGSLPLKTASVASNPKADPFGSLMDFRSNPPTKTAPPLSSNSNRSGSGDNSFGAFQNSSSSQMDTFGSFHHASSSKMDNFGMPAAQNFPFEKQHSSQPKIGADPLDMLFSSGVSAPATAASASSESQPFAEANDWDLSSEFGGNDTGGSTTELEGLPPPPSGVTVSVAKTKGLDNHKQGQYADAIKWFSWAVKLLEKSPDSSATREVLSCRASCYKEVGEYKKAIADCSKVLEYDNSNVTVLLQRALLYESSEKYKLGAEDLRLVLKIDPSNRLARSTIHRLSKLAG